MTKDTEKDASKTIVDSGDFTDSLETVPDDLPVAENCKLLKEAFRNSIVMKNLNLKPLLDA